MRILTDAAVLEINCDPATTGLGSPYLLDPQEQAAITARVDQFNSAISGIATARNWVYLDMKRARSFAGSSFRSAKALLAALTIESAPFSRSKIRPRQTSAGEHVLVQQSIADELVRPAAQLAAGRGRIPGIRHHVATPVVFVVEIAFDVTNRAVVEVELALARESQAQTRREVLALIDAPATEHEEVEA
jgi:hypothetical protein